MNGYLVVASLITAVVAGARGSWSPCGLSMVSAINPLAERGRGNRYWLTASWFIVGSLAGGLLLGLASAVPAWLLSRIGAPAAMLLGAAGCLVTLASDRRLAGWSLPIHPRQLNERWLVDYRRWLYAAGFGAQIGTGFATYLMTAATYLLVLLAALAGSAGFAALAGLSFGLVRGAAVLLSARCRTPQALQALHRTLSRLEPASGLVAQLCQAALLSWLAVLAAGWPGAMAAAGALGLLGAATRGRPGVSAGSAYHSPRSLGEQPVPVAARRAHPDNSLRRSPQIS